MSKDMMICPGCGSKRVEGNDHDHLWDCLNCTCYFDPEHPQTKIDQQRIREGEEPSFLL